MRHINVNMGDILAASVGFKTFWISIFELARNSFPVRYSASKHFEFRCLSWPEIQDQLDIRRQNILNVNLRASLDIQSKLFNLRASSKFKARSKFIVH